jgi:hypothetical protein
MFVGIILEKPSRDLTRPLGNSYGLKRLVAYAKCNRTSHERWIYLFVFLVIFCFVLSRDLQYVSLGV